jgi:hypothetical protein
LFQIAVGMMSLHEEELLEADNSADIFNILSTLPSKMDDIDKLVFTIALFCSTVDGKVE